jgi:hypothetical protein
LFDYYDTSEFITDPFVETSTQVKKLLQIEPNVQQLQFDVSGANFFMPANTQLDNVELGTLEDKLWNKKIKIRLTSKKTGKKIDLNIDYDIRTMDRTPIGANYKATDADGEGIYYTMAKGPFRIMNFSWE